MINSICAAVLDALRFSLFGGEKPTLIDIDVNSVLKEAKAQSVFSMVYSVYQDEIKNKTIPNQLEKYNEEYFGDISNSVRVQMEHDELHRILMDKQIPYVILKGCASAAYYPEPVLREMGDVDFLVKLKDIQKGIKTLEENGFQRDQYEFTTNQSAYHRPPFSVWEIHKEPTGIPRNECGNAIRRELSRIIEEAVVYNREGVSFFMPNTYHHGIILLLHKISHMTTTGIGLRHLCDWAVFVNSISNDDFIILFETKLKSFGIWKFAQYMTLICQEYLGLPKCDWAMNVLITPIQLETLMMDILSGGNFGKKDANRQREIKYITDRKEGKLGDKGLALQALYSLNEKVYMEYPIIKRYKVLLLGGWILESGKYTRLLFSKKRKKSKTISMLREASQRKNIYHKMNIFQTEK